ncbi:hypothetical protein [Cellulomonas aerilata]|uniref:Uncharacterized protein n=1 Tax=Cellulomonas aerilata TaxID=515326 RepID=A0A512D887_9CELL|nr:hypothetical protein [Cellulomonas aerilata]GEO32712.1 hypothetical protein CAE01nite_04370 [Cellulomonas aerilata]
MTVVPIERTVDSVKDLRDTHRSLRAERLRVTGWRRLVRARMGLVPEPLADAAGQTPGRTLRQTLAPGGYGDLPLPVGLLEAVGTGGPEGGGDRLESLRALDRRLAAYESTVAAAMRGVADELVERALVDGLPGVVHARPTAPSPMGHTVTWT